MASGLTTLPVLVTTQQSSSHLATLAQTDPAQVRLSSGSRISGRLMALILTFEPFNGPFVLLIRRHAAPRLPLISPVCNLCLMMKF